jgi:hypothetical protein
MRFSKLDYGEAPSLLKTTMLNDLVSIESGIAAE